MSDAEQLLLDNASSRANFSQCDDEDLEEIVDRLTIARAQADEEMVDDPTYRSQMEIQRSLFFHEAGRAGIDYKQANFIWWNFVWDNPAPCDRAELV